MLYFSVITLFPNIIKEYTKYSIIKRAQESKKICVKIYDLRDFAFDKHKKVDDKPFGGGAGMVLKIEPLHRAILKAKQGHKHNLVILTAPYGKIFSTNSASNIVKDYLENEDMNIIIICGHYQGIDARIEYFVDKTFSIGPYILTGGELPTLIILDAVTRLIPGVLHNANSLTAETEFEIKYNIKTKPSFKLYTKPKVFEYEENGKKCKLKVPDVLLSGNHREIKKWRERNTNNNGKLSVVND